MIKKVLNCRLPQHNLIVYQLRQGTSPLPLTIRLVWIKYFPCWRENLEVQQVFCRFCESDKSLEGWVGHFGAHKNIWWMRVLAIVVWCDLASLLLLLIWTVRKEQCSESMCAVTQVMLFSFVPFVDWAAHLGGILAGMLRNKRMNHGCHDCHDSYSGEQWSR